MAYPYSHCLLVKWLKDGGGQNAPIAQIANNSDDTSHASTTLTRPVTLASSNASLSNVSNLTDVTSLLAAALSLAGNNNAAKEAIADALNAIHNE